MVHIVELETTRDEDSDWENLDTSVKGELVTRERAVEASTSLTPNRHEHRASEVSDNQHQRRSLHVPRESGDQQDGLSMRQSIAEARSKIRQDLVDHPIKKFASRFGFHLLQEFWRLDVQIHLSLALIAAGLFWKILLLSTWYLWFPRMILLGTLLCASFLYLNPHLYNLQYWEELFSSTERVFECLGPDRLRNALCLVLFVPAILEMRAVLILTHIIVETGGLPVISCSTLVLSALFLLALNKKINPRDGKLYVLLFLYVVALFSSLFRLHVGRVYFLGAPFCFSAGVLLLITHKDKDWYSRVSRYALRLSLVDTFQSLGNSVREDEMLQLAVLRWIVDYWSNKPSEATNNNTNATTGFAETENAELSRPSGQNSEEATALVLRRPELEWNDLLPMLTMTAQQIQIEVDSLQSTPQFQPLPSTPPSSYDSQTRNEPYSHISNESVHNLSTMLSSMNIDVRAKPAVLAYRKSVSDLPPARRVAVLWALSRRAPALITFLYTILLGDKVFLSAMVLLLPLIGIEILSIQRWLIALQKAHDPSASRSKVELLDDIPPMVVLLSDDEYNPAMGNPNLLQVWYNIEDSAAALETGLTAARCVQTTALAVDFAASVFSLIQFGIEVSQRGWMHGLGVLVREMSEEPRSGSYTTAARRAYGNSQSLSHNLRLLAEEDAYGKVIMPVLHIIPALFATLFPGFQRAEPPGSSRILPDELIQDESGIEPITRVVEGCRTTNQQEACVDFEHRPKSPELMPVSEQNSASSDTIVDVFSQEQPDRDEDVNVDESIHTPLSDGARASESEDTSTATQVPIGNLSARCPLLEPLLVIQNTDDNEASNVGCESDRISLIMESISKCHIDGLIDAKEKDDLCEQLVRWTANEADGTEFLTATENTLRCLLQQQEVRDTTGRWSPLSTTRDNEECRSSSPAEDCLCHNVVVLDNAVQSAPVSTDDEAIIEKVNMDDYVYQLDSKTTDDDDFVPIETVSFELLENAQENKNGELDIPLPKREGDFLDSDIKGGDEENLWVKVGGSLAVFGAVVGGIALLAANSRDDERKRNEENTDGGHRVDRMASS